MDRYASVHSSPNGPGDARPTAEQIIMDQDLVAKLRGKNILITGGTAGLGTESARVLHQTGAQIFITARNAAKGEQTARSISVANPESPAVTVVEMDLSSLDSVRRGAAAFLAQCDQLHVLMTNAGIMACPEGRTVDGFETQFATNHLAHFLLFQLLKPALLAASSPVFHSRVISVSSAAHRFGNVRPDNYRLEGEYHPFAAYGQSKTANVLFANELERRYGSRGLHGLSLHPGVIFDTDLSRHQDGGAQGLHDRMLTAGPEMPHMLKNTAQGAATQVWAAVAQELEGKGGLYLDDVQVAKEAGPNDDKGFEPGYRTWIWDEEMAGRLWRDSLVMVGMKEADEADQNHAG